MPLLPCAGQKALLDLFRVHLPAGELRERGGKVRHLLHRQKKRERHGRAVVARLDPALVPLKKLRPTKGCAVLFGFQRTGGGYRESPLTFHVEKLRGLQPSFLIF